LFSVSLDTRVPSGVYKGLYTTKERSAFVQQLEQFVSGNTNADETLLEEKYSLQQTKEINETQIAMWNRIK